MHRNTPIILNHACIIPSPILGYDVRSYNRGLRVEQPCQDWLLHRDLWPHTRALHAGHAGRRGLAGPQWSGAIVQQSR